MALESYGICGAAETPQDVGHVCVTTGRRGSMPSLFQKTQAPAP